MAKRADLHVHTTASDGTDSPEEVLRKAREMGIDRLAVTDHDTAAGSLSVVGGDREVISGAEMSCAYPGGKCHILCLGADLRHPAMVSILAAAGNKRREKLLVRLDYLRRAGVIIPPDEREKLMAMSSAGKPHLGELISRLGYTSTPGEAIDRYVSPCPTPSDRLPAGEVIEAARAAGGAAVWAHPYGEYRGPELSREELLRALASLIGMGLTGIECWYSSYSIERCLSLERTARERALLVSGGSDYHGANKDIPLGRLNREGILVDPGRLSILDFLGV